MESRPTSADEANPEPKTGPLWHSAIRGLTDIAIDARLQYVSGGAMIDDRYWESVKALVDEVERLRHAMTTVSVACCTPDFAKRVLAELGRD